MCCTVGLFFQISFQLFEKLSCTFIQLIHFDNDGTKENLNGFSHIFFGSYKSSFIICLSLVLIQDCNLGNKVLKMGVEPSEHFGFQREHELIGKRIHYFIAL
ncbi:hypothetical protein D3C85_1409040 [compost metagenome]